MTNPSTLFKSAARFAKHLLATSDPAILDRFAGPLFRFRHKSDAGLEEYINGLNQMDMWSHEQLWEEQCRKLQLVAAFAYEAIPYYRRTWKAMGLRPEDLRSPADLRYLPIMTREELAAHEHELLDPRLQRTSLAFSSTGGTTGAPIRVYRDRNADLSRTGVYVRWKGRAHCDHLKDRFAYIGRPVPALASDSRRWGQRGERFFGQYDPRSRSFFMTSSNLSGEVVERYIHRLRRFAPTYLQGYASGVHQLAAALVTSGQTIPLRAVFTSSESLFEDTRDLVRAAFACDVWDHYSSNEMVASASECSEHAGYHVDMERCIVEVVDSEGRSIVDAVGTVCGTSLENYAMPLFRYSLNDLASLSSRQCNCGRGHTLIDQLIGRKDDYILTPEGVRITAPTIRMTFHDLGRVREGQVVQTSATAVNVRIVPTHTWTADDVAEATARFAAILGTSVVVTTHLVDAIDRSPSGKFRIIENRSAPQS